MKKQLLTDIIGTKGFWKRTLILALPIAFQNLLTSSSALIDTLMVGQLGDIALSSVGMAGQWSWLLNMVVFGICSGLSVLAAQYWGVKDKKNIHKISGIAIIIGVIISALFTLTGFFAPEFVIKIFNRTPEVVAQGSLYLRIVCFSFPGVVLSAVLGAVLRSTEEVKLPVYASAIATLCNIFLNYSLIFGAFGFPEMGVGGAALATCISVWIGLFIILIASFIQKNILYAPIRDLFKFDRKILLKFFQTASPVVLNESMWGLGTVLYNVIFANLGHENFAAVTILKTIENLSFIFFVGLCNACCIMVGTSVGAGEIKRAVKDSKRFGFLIPFVGFIVGVFVIIFNNQLITLFNLSGNLTEHTVNIAKIIMIIYAVELPIRNIPYVFIVGIFRSGGDTVNGTKIDIFSLWLLALPLTAILGFVVKVPFAFVFAAMYMGEDYVKCFLCIKHFISNKWLKPVTDIGKRGLEEFLNEKNTNNPNQY